MTSKIVKGLKTDSDGKTKVKASNSKTNAKLSLTWIHTQIEYKKVTN